MTTPGTTAKKVEKTSRSYGRPGLSARATYRTRRARYAQMSWRSRLGAFALLSAGGLIVGLAAHYPWWAGLAGGAGIALVLAALLSAPRALSLGGVLLAYIPLSLPLGAVYAAAPVSDHAIYAADAFGASTSLIFAAAIATWISVRFSRGRAWVTLALGLASTALIGYILVLTFPEMGLYAAYLSLALVLMIRCGGWSWLTGLVGLGVAKLRARGARDISPDGDVLSAWLRKAEAEQATAAALDLLDSNHAVFHDMKVGKLPNPLAHLVIAPAGVFLISSVSTSGPIRETASEGVQIPGVPVGAVTATLLTQRRVVARTLKMKESDLNLLIVVQPEGEAALEAGTRRTLAVFGRTDGELPSAHARLLTADMLKAEVDTGIEVLGSLSRSAAIQRAKMRLKPAGAPTPSRLTSLSPVQVASVDADGHTRRPERDVSWIVEAARVDLSTSAGMLRSLRATSQPYTDVHGRVVADVCLEEEWVDAQKNGREPASYPYPVSAIAPSS